MHESHVIIRDVLYCFIYFEVYIKDQTLQVYVYLYTISDINKKAIIYVLVIIVTALFSHNKYIITITKKYVSILLYTM